MSTCENNDQENLDPQIICQMPQQIKWNVLKINLNWSFVNLILENENLKPQRARQLDYLCVCLLKIMQDRDFIEF